uniref:Transposase n=1 Tax=Cacopsylla melanoneura TaxID=428564 RepID=A0A8D8ZE00_9HEMI
MTQPLARDRYQRTSMYRTRPFGEHENLFYPFHLQRVQGLLEREFEPRLQFCRWALVQLATVLNFLSSDLFTDEANFNRDGITNFHNNHIWATENPHGMVQKKNHQQTFSFNVWAGIIGDTLLGPYSDTERVLTYDQIKT